MQHKLLQTNNNMKYLVTQRRVEMYNVTCYYQRQYPRMNGEPKYNLLIIIRLKPIKNKIKRNDIHLYFV
jgi:hypothetical protein